MKYCKDCKHNKGGWCRKTRRTSLVTGKDELFTCNYFRRPYDGHCGVEAKWFEPAPLGLFRGFIHFILQR
jgi:hypothetical protein